MLRLEIDGSWEPQDFIEVLQSLESMYYKLAYWETRRSWPRPFYYDELYFFDRFNTADLRYETILDIANQRLLERARYEAPQRTRLSVQRITYASPGGIDLLGIGKGLEAISNSIGRMIVYFDERHLRRERDQQATLETEAKRIELEKERENLRALKIKNARDALDLFREHPDDREQLIPLLVRDQDALSSRIAEQKLISARASSGDDPERD